jgi:DNA polymerase-3 subunit epsilon
MNFAAIDFETATGYQHSACAVGIVTVVNGIIAEEFYSLIQPPDNEYWWQNIKVHGITPKDTLQAPTFDEIYPELRSRLRGKRIVAHNESFDRNVMIKSMNYYQLDYNDLELPNRWDCTVKMYRAKGFASAKLDICCKAMGIDLNHHEALSDARACAKLYLLGAE